MSPWKRLLLRLLAGTFLLTSFSSRAASTILTEPDFNALKAAIASSTEVRLAFDGTIQFPSQIPITKQVKVDGSGRSVTFSGGGRQFFCVTNGDLTLTGITLTGGFTPSLGPGSPGLGGAIFITNGTLRLNSCNLIGNRAQGGVANFTQDNPFCRNHNTFG
jgi:hypothetical protein